MRGFIPVCLAVVAAGCQTTLNPTSPGFYGVELKAGVTVNEKEVQANGNRDHRGTSYGRTGQNRRPGLERERLRPIPEILEPGAESTDTESVN